jgi:hypothetical protein
MKKCTVPLAALGSLRLIAVLLGGLTAVAILRPAHADDLADLAEKPILSREAIGEGANAAEKVTISVGGKTVAAVLKTADKERGARPGLDVGTFYVREAAAYVVAQRMNLTSVVPMTVKRTHLDDGTATSTPIKASIQLFRPGARTAYGCVNPRDDDLTDAKLNRHAAEGLLLFDYLTGNTDRHDFNLLITPTATPNEFAPVGIDNGLSFPKAPVSVFFWPIDWLDGFVTAGSLDAGVKRAINALDPAALALDLRKAGLEEEAVKHTLYRLTQLKTHLAEVLPRLEIFIYLSCNLTMVRNSEYIIALRDAKSEQLQELEDDLKKLAPPSASSSAAPPPLAALRKQLSDQIRHLRTESHALDAMAATMSSTGLTTNEIATADKLAHDTFAAAL